MRRTRPYRGIIACEFCGHVVGGGTKSGLFANYNSHCLARHDGYQARFLSQGGEPCRCPTCRKAREAKVTA